MLHHKKVIVGITGSIAAYKTILLVRLLVKAGAEVKVVMTPAARDFVSPLVLSTLSRNEVSIDLFREENWNNHVALGRWADLMVIAPLSCNTLSKMAAGMCDNLLLAVYLSATCPVWFAPAMDEDMWHHPSVQENLSRLQVRGHRILPVGTGELASGLTGEGRMAEPQSILDAICKHFEASMDLIGKRFLVTAGPTYEPLDPVRFIGNRSSGKMGLALGAALKRRGANVVMVLGPIQEALSFQPDELWQVQQASEMYDACVRIFPTCDGAFMTAAVADYKPAEPATRKIKKYDDALTLSLERTKDILLALGQMKKQGQVLVGFALETHDGEGFAQKKLESKNADLIVLNSLSDPGAGFGTDTNKVTIFRKAGLPVSFPVKLKSEVADDIIDVLKELSYE
ncbi:MAG TPA: bifunctional phosphopantothenoylcysteine decarboxylase/phosphopantothenate--cysteine ligase CoaBC [Lacibacter sp.]|nr:bifunctional phosphopantothenoylcysteine decarboxylase/phosphopantothenate--cysteine ligase CoaBC [Lacibacter sp.]HMO89453.1 bifunctional phosphopantothenoylcysteine decarboxylase/phosphopantothenate--cysteine ligase CoaBC [Lacibacter sp.]